MHQLNSPHPANAAAFLPGALGLSLSLVCGLAAACASPPRPVAAAAQAMQTTTTTTTSTTQDYGGNVGEGEEHEYEPWTETWGPEDAGVRRRRPKVAGDAGARTPPEAPVPSPVPMPVPMPGAPKPIPEIPPAIPLKPQVRPLTAMDQGRSRDELAITASIRKEMMVSRELSFGAKNVKVITTGARVTLRGQVSTQAERDLIEALARRTPGVGDVDSKLEVKK